jgi:hypothetical protein
MTISESKIKQIIREETKRALREADVKGATFHQDPITGKWVTGGEDFPGAGGRAAMRLREPGMRSVGDPDYLKSLRFDDEDSEGEGEGETPYDPKIRPTFMNSTSADRRDDSDMGSGGGGGDSESVIDPDKRSDDPFYSGGHRVIEQRSLNFRSIVKEETLKFLRNRR